MYNDSIQYLKKKSVRQKNKPMFEQGKQNKRC